MILDALLWLPIKVAKHFLEPVTDMLDRLGQMSNEELDDYYKGKQN
jgi:hypothetical protein